MFAQFFQPYIQIFFGAAYNIQQSLDGYGFSSSDCKEFYNVSEVTGNCWSPFEASIMPAFFVIAYFVLILLPLIFSSGYIFNRVKGVIFSLSILMLPGIMNLIDWWPDVKFTPEAYTIGGTGVVGEILGYFPLIVIGVLTG